MNKSNACHYDLEFMHPSRSSLIKLIKNSSNSESFKFHFKGSPVKIDSLRLHSVTATVSAIETGSDSLTDDLKALLSKVKSLEIGGTFMDHYGRGYVNCFGEKDYTRYIKKKKDGSCN
ncbi:MAG: hypothetical protein O3A15_00045 [Proteobacteria bacterium]|nr:hypothetical protein [Pseudomonadota bacterium]